MKKFILLLTGLYISIVTATSAIEAMIASGVASGLMPLLKPLAEETALASIKHVKAILTGATCPIVCRGPTGIPCVSKKVRSSCKQTCQTPVPIEGYTIKIRFGNDWSLMKCVGKGVDAKDPQTALGKQNFKSIAIYTQPALDDILNLLAVRKAARRVANLKGFEIEDVKGVAAKDVEAPSLRGRGSEEPKAPLKRLEREDVIMEDVTATDVNALPLTDFERIRNNNETLKAARARAVQQAKDLITHIDEEIKQNFMSNIYGPQ